MFAPINTQHRHTESGIDCFDRASYQAFIVSVAVESTIKELPWNGVSDYKTLFFRGTIPQRPSRTNSRSPPPPPPSFYSILHQDNLENPQMSRRLNIADPCSILEVWVDSGPTLQHRLQSLSDIWRLFLCFLPFLLLPVMPLVGEWSS